MHMSSTFLTVTQPLLIADRATIPHFNQDIQGFHMIPNTQIFWLKQACSEPIIPLNVGSLVLSSIYIVSDSGVILTLYALSSLTLPPPNIWTNYIVVHFVLSSWISLVWHVNFQLWYLRYCTVLQVSLFTDQSTDRLHLADGAGISCFAHPYQSTTWPGAKFEQWGMK